MAAGRGTRISAHIDGAPKSTLLVNKEPLIKHTVKMLLTRGIEVCVVVGYRQKDVLKCLENLPVEVVENPFYMVTNSLASLWLARHFWSNNDILLMNADLLIEDDILDAIIDDPRSPVMAADPLRTLVGDFFFSYTPDQHLAAYGKGLPVEKRDAEYLGIAKILKRDRLYCLKDLDSLVKNERYDDWWERMLYHQVEEGKIVHVMEIDESYWSEIDSYEDYLGIQADFCQNEKLRYG